MTLKRDWKCAEVRRPASSYSKRFEQRTYEKRREEERDRQVAMDAEKRMKDEFRARRDLAAKKRVAKSERKKANEVQNGTYQVIKNTKKLRKYDRKAMAKVIKMSAEQIEALVAKR